MDLDRRLAGAVLAVFSIGVRAAAQGSAEFLGPATCDATSCHGSVRPADARIAQNEYVTWFTRDDHRKAWEVLKSPFAIAMGRRLGLDDVSQTADCIACHAVPAGSQDKKLLEFGVSCEACHGAAAGWYGSHFQPGFDRAAAVEQHGLRDLRDPAQLAATCLGCHLGDADRSVDHALIAAGHPELTFELGTSLLDASPHWRQRGAESREWLQRATLVGQAVALREQLRKLVREVGGGRWPEYASFDCASCHHDLATSSWRALRDWRLARGRPTPLGRPLFDGTRIVTTRAAVGAMTPALESELAAALADVERLLAEPNAPRDEVKAAAEKAAALCDRATKTLGALADPHGAAQAAVTALVLDAELVAAQGFRGAEQAGLMIYSLRLDFDRDQWRPTPDGGASRVEHELLAPLTRREEFDPVLFARRLSGL